MGRLENMAGMWGGPSSDCDRRTLVAAGGPIRASCAGWLTSKIEMQIGTRGAESLCSLTQSGSSGAFGVGDAEEAPGGGP